MPHLPKLLLSIIFAFFVKKKDIFAAFFLFYFFLFAHNIPH
jgi:hypothetical protein